MEYIPNSNHDPALNLAMEEYILTSGEFREPVLFFYVNAPSIIIGRHQNTIDEINADFVRENSIQVVRRCSGGGAVYHDLGNLNYSLIKPGDLKASGDFSVLLLPILDALHELGLPAELGGRNDLLLNGAKFSGNAYYHNRSGSVTHGTLLFNSDLTVLAKALRPDPEKLRTKGIQSVRSRVVCIKEYLPGLNAVDDLEKAIVRHFDSINGITTRYFSPSDKAGFEDLANRKYRTSSWNYGESPAYTFRSLVHQPSGWIDFRADIREGKVHDARFFGDFFCEGEISALEDAIRKSDWKESTIQNKLGSSGWNRFFPNYPLESFIAELFSTKANV